MIQNAPIVDGRLTIICQTTAVTFSLDLNPLCSGQPPTEITTIGVMPYSLPSVGNGVITKNCGSYQVILGMGSTGLIVSKISFNNGSTYLSLTANNAVILSVIPSTIVSNRLYLFSPGSYTYINLCPTTVPTNATGVAALIVRPNNNAIGTPNQMFAGNNGQTSPHHYFVENGVEFIYYSNRNSGLIQKVNLETAAVVQTWNITASFVTLKYAESTNSFWATYMNSTFPNNPNDVFLRVLNLSTSAVTTRTYGQICPNTNLRVSPNQFQINGIVAYFAVSYNSIPATGELVPALITVTVN